MVDTTSTVCDGPHPYVPDCPVAATAARSVGIAKMRPPIGRIIAARHFAGAVA